MTDKLTGSIIDGKYKVTEELGAGGLGTVYKALQPELSREVAVKILHNSALSDPDSLARFEREARILGTIKHKNIVGVYSFGLDAESRPYLAMELLKGQSLSNLISDSGNLDWKRTSNIAIQTCLALQAAHDKGIIHRDLKPQNIFLMQEPEPDFVKVLDFGLSSLLPGQSSNAQKLTQTGALVGSIPYMSPEVCQGQRADERSDIYSLGCTLYECLTGHPPFENEHPIMVLQQHINEMPEPLRKGKNRLSIPEEIELIIFKSLQKDPANRFQSMNDFERALELVRQGNSLDDTLAGITVRTTDSAAGGKVIPALLLIGGIVATGGLVGYFINSQHAQEKTAAREEVNSPESAILASRNKDIDRAMAYVALAKESLKEGNGEKARVLIRRAMAEVGHKYPLSKLDKSCTLRDISLLEDTARVLEKLGTSRTTDLGKYLEIIERNDTPLFLKDQPARMRFQTALEKIYEAEGNVGSAARSYYHLIYAALQEGDSSKCKEIAQKARSLRNAEKFPFALFYILLTEAEYAISMGDDVKAAATCEQATELLRKSGTYRNGPYIELCCNLLMTQQKLKDLKPAETTMLTMIKEARKIRAGYYENGDVLQKGGVESYQTRQQSLQFLKQLSHTADNPVLKDMLQKEIDSILQAKKAAGDPETKEPEWSR